MFACSLPQKKQLLKSPFAVISGECAATSEHWEATGGGGEKKSVFIESISSISI